MQLNLESFSRETTCLHATECARGCDVIACAAGNKRIGSESARRETDRPVTDPNRIIMNPSFVLVLKMKGV